MTYYKKEKKKKLILLPQEYRCAKIIEFNLNLNLNKIINHPIRKKILSEDQSNTVEID